MWLEVRHGLICVIPASSKGRLTSGQKAGIQSIITLMRGNYYSVYILSSHKNGTLYIGITNNLVRRVWEHKNQLVEGFTNKYEIHHLVYYELHENPESAITREKQIKKWRRLWKLNLIEEKNPTWKDLYKDIL